MNDLNERVSSLLRQIVEADAAIVEASQPHSVAIHYPAGYGPPTDNEGIIFSLNLRLYRGKLEEALHILMHGVGGR